MIYYLSRPHKNELEEMDKTEEKITGDEKDLNYKV